MSISVDEIASSAFDAVVLEISGVIKSGMLEKVTKGSYDISTDAYVETKASTVCRLVFDVSGAVFDTFPGYLGGHNDKAAYVLSTAAVPAENDKIMVDTSEYTVIAASDIAGAASFYGVVLR